MSANPECPSGFTITKNLFPDLEPRDNYVYKLYKGVEVEFNPNVQELTMRIQREGYDITILWDPKIPFDLERRQSPFEVLGAEVDERGCVYYEEFIRRTKTKVLAISIDPVGNRLLVNKPSGKRVIVSWRDKFYEQSVGAGGQTAE